MKRFAPLVMALMLAATISWLRGPSGATAYRERRILMDTLVTVTAYPPPGIDPVPAVDAAFREMARVEQVFSSYLPNSPVGQLNREGRLDSAPEELRRLLERARVIAKASGGTYDPTLGELSSVWGFGPGSNSDAAARTPPTTSILSGALARAGVDQIEAEADGLRLRRGGRLDLGGFAKGYAVDRAVEHLKSAGLAALVDAGGDLACTGPKPGGAPWRVGVRHPRVPEELLGVVALDDGAIATSGDYERHFDHAGQRYHHLLSPVTGRPAHHRIQATVRAASCAAADAWATAFFVAPPIQVQALKPPEDVHALLVAADLSHRVVGRLSLEAVR